MSRIISEIICNFAVRRTDTNMTTADIKISELPEEVTEDLVKDISRLEPFGASNPSPLFVIRDFKLSEKKLMGPNHDHLKLMVEKNGITLPAIWWSVGDINLKKGDTLDIAFSPNLLLMLF